MCNLYSITKGQKAIRDLAKAMIDKAGNMPSQPAVFPDQLAPVVRTTPDGARELTMMRWGFPPPPRAAPRPVTNVRHTHSGFWRPWLQPAHRCLVPVTSFCEYDHRSGKVVPTWFALDKSRPLFFFAGIWRSWKGTRGTKANPVEGNHMLFSFLTTEPNKEVGEVHEKAMPVLLLGEAERETWTTAPWEAAQELQKPSPGGTLHIVATGKKEDQ